MDNRPDTQQTPDLNEWIPRRARLAYGLRAEATTGTEAAEATETAPKDTKPKATETDQKPEKPAWEQRLDSILEGGEADAETEPTEEEAQAAEAEAVEAEAGEESTEEEAPGAVGEGEEDAETETGTETDDEDDLSVLRLPGRRPDDEDFELPIDAEALEAAGIDPKEAAERVNQLRNGYMRGSEVREAREAVRGQQGELDFIYRELQERPGEFLTQNVHASHYPDLLKNLIVQLDDSAYEQVLNHIGQLDRDTNARERARLDIEKQRIQHREERQQQRQSSDYVKQVRTEIINLVPEDMDDARADEFFDYAIFKLESYARQNPGQRLQPDRVPVLLQELGALDPFGLSQNGEATTRTDDATAPNADRAKKGPKGKDTEQKRAGQDLRKRADSRKNAAVSPAGATTGASPTKPPRGQSFDERMAWIEKHGTG